MAVRNPDYKPDAQPDSDEAQPIHVIKPDHIISFDESRVKMNMTAPTKSKESRIVVDKRAPAASRQETLTNKVGLVGTDVDGFTASPSFSPSTWRTD